VYIYTKAHFSVDINRKFSKDKNPSQKRERNRTFSSFKKSSIIFEDSGMILPPLTPFPTPSVTPSVSITPSVTTTPSISITPSLTPSETPSVTPSLTPSETPSITPSETPSVSITPSETPSITPSETPSLTPSETPSITPSETPSVSITPSETPSLTPSETPSVTPSETPSITPSETPSLTPSETPSETPSLTPSETPSLTPSETPSITPSITLSITPSVTLTPTPSPLTIVTSGLQLYLNAGDNSSYPGSGTSWTDLSPNGYVATLTNGVGYSSNNGGTLTFTSTQYVDTNQSLISEAFTVGGWFKTTSGGIQMILSKETAGGWPWNYRVWLNGGQIVGDIALTGGQNVAITSPLTNYNSGNWYQVMFTRDDSNLFLYINGTQIRTIPDTLVGSITNSQELWIGLSAYLGGSYQFSGDISEVMMYNRVLSSTEILQNYNATKTRFGL